MYWPAALGALWLVCQLGSSRETSKRVTYIDAISAIERTTVNIPIITARKIQMTPDLISL
jgi:hypothetical protein